MRKKKLFGESFIDEVALFADIEQRVGTPLTPAVLTEITNESGIDHATAVLYQHLRKRHAAFIDMIEGGSILPAPALRQTTIVVVPGMFYREYPEMGCDGAFIRGIVERFGFSCQVVETRSRGSISANAKLISETVAKVQGGDIWIVSFSKGSAETRLFLGKTAKSGDPTRVRGWISISGTATGTPLADEKLGTPFARVIWSVTALTLGIHRGLASELARQAENTQYPELPEEVEVIHVAGFPLRSHLQPLLIKRHGRLSKYGPNDGIIVLGDFLDMPGRVYPIWGVDHFLRTHSVSALIYRLCNYINRS